MFVDYVSIKIEPFYYLIINMVALALKQVTRDADLLYTYYTVHTKEKEFFVQAEMQ